jgi:Mg2+-importing ATPase
MTSEAVHSRRHEPQQRPFDWRSWLPGLALLALVVVGSLHFSEAREFVRLAERARPVWLIAAFVLQALTYLAQSEIFRAVGRARDFRLPLATAYRLSLLKLFVDQAFPSAGLSGTAIAARELTHCGMPRALIASSVVISIVSYQIAYATAVLAALAVIAGHDRANTWLVVGSITFALVVSSWSAIVMMLSTRSSPLSRAAERVRPLRALVDFVSDADGVVTHDLRTLACGFGCQLSIIALDASTIWVLLLSLGAWAQPDVVFASFVLASVLRTIGLLPGGLGTFEAMSVLALNLAGVPVSTALAATLMFRGMSFWLPMLVGFVIYRRLPHVGTTRASQP